MLPEKRWVPRLLQVEQAPFLFLLFLGMVCGSNIWTVVHLAPAIPCHHHAWWRVGTSKAKAVSRRMHSRQYTFACIKVVSTRSGESTIWEVVDDNQVADRIENRFKDTGSFCVDTLNRESRVDILYRQNRLVDTDSLPTSKNKDTRATCYQLGQI